MSEFKQKALKKAAGRLKKAIVWMKDLQIPITPENYFVWYEYEKGNNSELTKTIDKYLKSGADFTESLNKDLFERYFSARNTETVTGVQESTSVIVDKLLSELGRMQTGTQNFTSTLEENRKNLKNNPDLDAITQLVSYLIANTEKMREVNASMEGKLNDMKKEVGILKSDLEAEYICANTDQLTKVPNRRAFDASIAKLLEEYEIEGTLFSLLYIDIDHFKAFNDTHGHAIGDKVLSYIASILKKGIKGSDMVARYGGEEFVVLLPKTNYQGAMIVAQQLCDQVAKNTLTMGAKNKTSLGKITISVGVALISTEDDAAHLMSRADTALYQAKEQGRNRVVGKKNSSCRGMTSNV